MIDAGMSRRGFLSTAVATGVAAGMMASLGAAAKPGRFTHASGGGRSPGSNADDPLFTISLAQWSLHKSLRAGTLKHLDFPAYARHTCGIDAVEYVNSFFEKKSDPAYNTELRRRCDDAGVASVLIMCDGEGALGDPDESKRAQAVENHRKWLDAAAALGCHSIRVNAQSSGGYDEQMDLAADGLSRLCELAEAAGLSVLVENHWGLSSNGAWLTGVMRKVARKNCGTLPDFGNFDVKAYDRYVGVTDMMPWAKGVSAKSYAFDDTGQETTIDYPRMLKIVLDAGYRGRIGIEYEGSNHSEVEGIALTKSLLETVRADMARAR